MKNLRKGRRFAILEMLFAFLLVIVLGYATFALADADDGGAGAGADRTAGITGEVITGKASSQQFSVSLYVDNNYPYVSIISPSDRSNNSYPFNYYNANNISLNISAYDYNNSISAIWYNLDDGVNASFISNTTINVSEGAHILRAYVNDSVGNVNSTNRSFSVNSSLGWFLCTTKYDGSTSNFTEIVISGKVLERSISNFTLERVLHGKAVFNDEINVSRDLCHFSVITSLVDDYSNILSSKSPLVVQTYSNPVFLPELNKSATIWLYNLSTNGVDDFSNPRIMRNGEVCPSSVCVIESYINGTFKFNVSHFGATYSVNETVSEVVYAPSAASEGGAGFLARLSADREEISVSLFPGENKKEKIVITNTGTHRASVVILSEEISDFLKISPSEFGLGAGESREIEIEFNAWSDIEPDIYIGKIRILVYGAEIDVPVRIEVESGIALAPGFDIGLELEKTGLAPEEEIEFGIDILGVQRGEKVLLEYFIKDENGNDILKESEEIIMGDEKIAGRIRLPEDIAFGRYILYVKANYKGAIASASAMFRVLEYPAYLTAYISLILALIVLISIWLIWKKMQNKIYVEVKAKDGKAKTIVYSRNFEKARKAVAKFRQSLKKKMAFDKARGEFVFKGDLGREIREELSKN